MYKLFLCLRYLRRRYIALVAILGMALCVAMVLIVVSVMNGFLDLVADAAKGMMGDVIAESGGAGVPHYEDLIERIEEIDGVEAATPVVYSQGLLRIGPSYTQSVQLAGIEMSSATKVSRLGDGIYPDELKAAPKFAVAEALRPALRQIREQYLPERDRFRESLQQVEDRLDEATTKLQEYKESLAVERAKPLAEQDAAAIAGLGKSIRILAKGIGLDEIREGRLRLKIARINRQELYDEEMPGILLGSDLPGVAERDSNTGEYTRHLKVGEKVLLTLLPVGPVRSTTQVVRQPFTVVGDCRMGIYQVDSRTAYVDFHKLQQFIELDAASRPDGLARCSQIQVKVSAPATEARISEVARKVNAEWLRCEADRQAFPGLAESRAVVRTWREKQAAYIGPIETQRTLVTIMFGVVSLVAVVLVFAIFYMMIVQKTKDIGVLKSIGASSGGVAGIFLLYGAAVGLVGSILGAIAGCAFVHYINPIHDWVARVSGTVVFDKKAYMFDRIPNQIDPRVVVWIVVGAIVAGVVGATLPAIRAGRMQPVEALRYE